MKTHLTRRSALAKMAGSAAAVTAAAASLSHRLTAADAAAGANLKGRINHSVCKWCYPKVSLENLCVAGKEMGLQSIELLLIEDFPTLKQHGLICAMVSGVPPGPGCCCPAGFWASPRRSSSALALAAVFLMPLVAADHSS